MFVDGSWNVQRCWQAVDEENWLERFFSQFFTHYFCPKPPHFPQLWSLAQFSTFDTNQNLSQSKLFTLIYKQKKNWFSYISAILKVTCLFDTLIFIKLTQFTFLNHVFIFLFCQFCPKNINSIQFAELAQNGISTWNLIGWQKSGRKFKFKQQLTWLCFEKIVKILWFYKFWTGKSAKNLTKDEESESLFTFYLSSADIPVVPTSFGHDFSIKTSKQKWRNKLVKVSLHSS